MDHIIEEIVLTGDDIVAVCKRIGQEISTEYQNKCPVLIGLLKGCVPFMAELMKYIECEMEIGFMDVSSYQGVQSTGTIAVLYDITIDMKDRHVILVEDIVDTGLTIQEVIKLLKERGAASIEVATLLNKPAGRVINCQEPKYIGKTIEPKFVVGFGLDYNQLYRNLNYVGVLKRSVYEK